MHSLQHWWHSGGIIASEVRITKMTGAARRRSRRNLRGLELQEDGNTVPEERSTVTDTSIESLSGLLDILVNMNTNKTQFKPPKYNGTTDVELFITLYRDVAEMNKWSDRETVMHLRASLEGSAADYGSGETSEVIYESLRGRYGLTSRQARDRLDAVKHSNKQNLHDYASEITKLVNIAYPTLDKDFKTQTSLEKFQRGLTNSRLRQHLLTMLPQTMTEAVRYAEEFLELEPATKPSLHAVEYDEEDDKQKVADKPMKEEQSTDKLDILFKAIEGLIASQTAFLTTLTKTQEKTTSRSIGPCYYCNKQGHMKKDCRKLKAEQNSQQTRSQSGNELNPAQ